MAEPIYTDSNCTPAYELRWSLAIFPRAGVPAQERWSELLRSAAEQDDVRILEHHRPSQSVLQFLVSTTPRVAPHAIVKSVKGRLQHAIRTTHPRAFRRNYYLASVGDARREVVEAYVASQLGHHRMADVRAQQLLSEFQLTFPQVDLGQPEATAHGRYIYNLHLVFVHESRSHDLDKERLIASRDMILNAAQKKGHRISRLSLVSDHIHMTLGCGIAESPAAVALGYMNNIAFAQGMKAMFCFSYYVGTFGEYDMGAIRGALAASRGSTDAGSVEAWQDRGRDGP